MVMTFCQSSEAVVYPILSNENQSTSEGQIDQKLKRVNAELQEIVLEMKDTKDQRKDKVENIRKDLERVSRNPTPEKSYCVGKIAWALDEQCPE